MAGDAQDFDTLLARYTQHVLGTLRKLREHEDALRTIDPEVVTRMDELIAAVVRGRDVNEAALASLPPPEPVHVVVQQEGRQPRQRKDGHRQTATGTAADTPTLLLCRHHERSPQP